MAAIYASVCVGTCVSCVKELLKVQGVRVDQRSLLLIRQFYYAY